MLSPVFGRDALLRAARTELDEGHVAGVLLCGPAGVGKTYTAEALVDALDGPVWRVYATSSDLPLGALAPYLPADLADGGLGPTIVLKRLLADEEVAPTVLVDDASVIDVHSAEALMHAADSGHIRIVLTQRDGTALPDVLDGLLRRGGLTRFEVAELNREATADLASHLAGGPLAERSVAEIQRVTQGNALYVREVVRAAIDTNRLRLSADGFVLEGIPAETSRLVDLVAQRLGALAPDEREAMVTLAAAEPLGPGELGPLVSDDTLRRLDDLGHLTTTLENRRLRIRLSHPLHGEVLRADTSPLRIRAIRAEVAGRIASLGARRRDDRLRMATWSLDGGVEVEAGVLHEAARTAFIAGDTQLSERLAETAFEQAPSFDVGWTLDVARYEQGEPSALLAHYERWEPLIRNEADRAVFVQARANGTFWRVGDVAGLYRLLTDFETLEGAPRNEVMATASSLLVVHGEIDRAVDLATQVLAGEPSRASLYAALALAHGFRAQGRPEAAASVAATAMEVARTMGPEAFLISDAVLGSARAHALAEAGELDNAEQVTREAAVLGEEIGSAPAVGLANLVRGWVEMLRGRPEAAIPILEQSRAWMERGRHPGMYRWSRMALALAEAQSGDHVASAKEIGGIDAAGPHPAGIFEATLARARAWTAHHKGFPEEAAIHLREASDVARARGNAADTLTCLHDLARVGRGHEAAGLLDRVPDGLDGALFPAQRRQIEAIAANDLDGLEAGVDGFESAGFAHFAIDGADAAAVAASKDHDGRLVNDWLRRAGQIRASLGNERSSDVVVPASLTRREREVALLASQGLANRDIGERLYVSPRTVESHLARIYGKLDVSGRAELADVLRGTRG